MIIFGKTLIMKIHLLIFPAVIIPMLSCAWGRESVPSFDPAEAVMISEPTNKVAHASDFVFYGKDEIFFTYYKDDVAVVERPENLTTSLWLAKSNLKSPSAAERVCIMEVGQTVGDYTQGDLAPYDPAIYIEGTTARCLFMGYENGERVQCKRDYDITEGRFADHIERCTISYTHGSGIKTLPYTRSGIMELYNDLGLAMSDKFINGVLNFKLKEIGGEYYSVISGPWSEDSRPLVVKTTDFVNYSLVFVAREFIYGCTETAIEPTDGGIVLLARSGRPEDKSKSGTWLGKYSLDGTCLVAPWMIGNNDSRPDLLTYKGRLYAFYNVKPDLKTEDGSIRRSRMRISRLTSDCSVTASWEFTSPYGIHYFCTREHNGKVYMLFSEDRRKINLRQTRSDLAFTEIKFK